MIKKYAKDYFGLNYLLSLIIAIIPFSSWVCGAFIRFKERKYIAGLIRLFLGFNIIWIADIISMVMKKKIFRFLNK